MTSTYPLWAEVLLGFGISLAGLGVVFGSHALARAGLRADEREEEQRRRSASSPSEPVDGRAGVEHTGDAPRDPRSVVLPRPVPTPAVVEPRPATAGPEPPGDAVGCQTAVSPGPQPRRVNPHG